MSRIGGRLSPGTTGFLATMVLTGALATVASSLWTPRHASPTAVAIDNLGSDTLGAPAPTR